MRGRFSAKAGENQIEAMLDRQQDYVGKRVTVLTGEIADMTRAKDILAGYRYDAKGDVVGVGTPMFPVPMGRIYFGGG